MRPPPTNVGKLLNLLTPDDADQFRKWARYRTIAEVHKRVQEIYEELETKPEFPCPSIWSAENWLRQQYPKGQQAEVTVESIRGFHGISEDCLSFAEAAIATTATNLLRIQKEIEQTEPGSERLGSLLYLSHNLAKELRTGAIALHETKRLEDARLTYLTGAYRLAQKIEAAEPENAKQVMQHKLKGALIEIEAEVKNG